jgi:hypothetical protein
VPPSTPSLRISEIDGRVRLGLDGFSDVEGDTLQQAADELVTRLLSIAMVIRSGGIGPLCSECCPDLSVLDFVWQLGELAAAGRDPRELLFGPNPLSAA